jgi:hypothetical protein
VTARVSHHSGGIATVLFLLLLVPPAKHGLEASMTTQMLVQIPLLVVVGVLQSRALPTRKTRALAGWNEHGITGFVLATLVAAVWMLRRSLDAAVTNPWFAVAKYLSIPLLIGLPFALSWPRMGFIVRGVFLLELIATFFRLGWLYLIWPGRLCNSYLLGDQQRLGRYMVLIGAALFLWTAGMLLWGRLGEFAEPRPPALPQGAGAHQLHRGLDA